jgi:DNA-binding NarL/FixJ family response regulator
MYGMTEVRSAWDLPSLIEVLEDAEPRVILVKMSTHGINLLLRAATSFSPKTPVIALAASEDDESGIIACAEAGVAGYHMRTESFAALLALINDVAAGKASCPPSISAMLLRRLSALAQQRMPAARDLALTTRETQILEMLELGRSNQDIAAQLSIAVHTVKNHVHSLLTKLGVGTRAEAAALSHSRRMDQDVHGRARPRSIENWP